MPILDVTYPAGALDAAARTTLVEELTTVLLRAERAPDTEFFRSITWVYTHELPAHAVNSAGQPVTAPTFRIEVTVPEGGLSDRRKGEFVAEATRVVCGIAGIDDADALRVWVLIREVPDGNWGAAGQVIRFEQLRELAARERVGASAS